MYRSDKKIRILAQVGLSVEDSGPELIYQMLNEKFEHISYFNFSQKGYNADMELLLIVVLLVFWMYPDKRPRIRRGRHGKLRFSFQE